MNVTKTLATAFVALLLSPVLSAQQPILLQSGTTQLQILGPELQKELPPPVSTEITRGRYYRIIQFRQMPGRAGLEQLKQQEDTIADLQRDLESVKQQVKEKE